MAQGYDKYELPNSDGASFRANLNLILRAAVEQNSGDDPPNTTNTTYPYQVWVDTDQDIVKIRDAAAAGTWYSLYSVDSDGKPTGAVAYGSYSISTNDTAGTGGTTAITVDTSQRVGIGTTTPSTPGGTNADNPLNGQVVSVYGSSPALDLVASSATGYSLINFGRDGASSNPYRFVVGYDQANDLGVLAARNQIVFKTDDALDGTNERFRITSTGILSVNETTPNANRLMTIRSDGTRNAGIVLRNTAATDVCQLTIENASTSEDAGLYTKGNLKLYGNGTERTLFNVDGICQIRTQANNGFVCASQQSAGTSNFLFQGGHSSTGPGSYSASFRVSTNGDITNTNNSLSAISDLKLKENIVDAKSQWDDIKGIRLRNYNFKAETGHETHTQLGVIAQELEAVCPKLVKETADEDGETTKSVAYSVLYMKAVGALQEAMERIEELEAKVAALESA